MPDQTALAGRRSASEHRARLMSAVAIAASLWLGGCAARTAEAPVAPHSPAEQSPAAARSNLVCDSVRDRFIGLPAAAGSAGDRAPGPTPLAGQWWVQRCSLAPDGRELVVRLGGPGWYWVDMERGDFALRQQVRLDIDVELAGALHLGYRKGIVSLWFEPTREPKVAIRASDDLAVRGATLRGSLLRRVPFLSIRERIAAALSAEASSAFREQLARGATVTYDVRGDRADVALEQLRPGTAPARAFDDGAPGVVNDRVLLPPGTTHAFGPVAPAAEYQLDVINEQGAGLEYRALCAQDLRANFASIWAGAADRIAPQSLVAHGTVLGDGRHAAALHVSRCPFYIVVSPAPNANTTTLVRLRLRA